MQFNCFYLSVNPALRHWLACGVSRSLYLDIYNEAAPVLDALNLSVMVWLNTITDPPFHTEK